MGPVIENLYRMGAPALLDELEIWSVGTFPLAPIPGELASSVVGKGRVITIEEHYRACGLGEAVSHLLLTSGVVPKSFTSLHAVGYPSGRYGRQRWHQEECGLAGGALASRLEGLLRG
jgi:transketolase C-terminal domain/subunit